MDWPLVKLYQITEQFISGGTPSTRVPEYWSGDIPWITGADINDRVVLEGRKQITKEAIENSATNIVPRGAILLVTRTGVGKIAKAGVDIAISQDLTGIVLKEKIEPDFVIAAINHKINSLIYLQQGSTIKGILRNDVENMEIPLPPLSEQRRIVEILDQADALRKNRAEADAKAERILPALFYKTFGDPLSLLKKREALELSACEVEFQNGFACGEKDVPDGTPHLRMNNIDDAGVLNLDLIRTVPVEFNREKYRLSNGDVLFMSTNSEDKIGKACVFYAPDNQNYLFSNHLTRIKITGDNLTPEYLASHLHLLWRKGFYPPIAKRWVNQASVSQEALYRIRIYIPEKYRLTKFSEQFRDLLRFRQKRLNAKQQLDTLFINILHRAFSGTLTAKWREAHTKELLAEMEEQAKLIDTKGLM